MLFRVGDDLIPLLLRRWDLASSLRWFSFDWEGLTEALRA